MTETHGTVSSCPGTKADPCQGGTESQAQGGWRLPAPCICEAAADGWDLQLSSRGVQVRIEGKEPRDQRVAPGLISLFVMIRPQFPFWG